jgi:hypothetical protein
MKLTQCLVISTLLSAWTGLAFGQDLMIFPNDDQSAEQQEADEFTCYKWARGESGFDPMEVPTATEPPPPQQAQKGGTGRGLLRGAAIGGIIDGSDGAKTGAMVGATVGTMRRNDQRRQQEQAEQQWADEQSQIYAQGRDNYNRGYSACMESKGYTVR